MRRSGVRIPTLAPYISRCSAVSVAFGWDQKVAGSNPVTSTNLQKRQTPAMGVFLYSWAFSVFFYFNYLKSFSIIRINNCILNITAHEISHGYKTGGVSLALKLIFFPLIYLPLFILRSVYGSSESMNQSRPILRAV